LGVRAGADWLRYTAVDADGTPYAGADVRSFNTSATLTAFVEVARPLCVVADAGIGSALHSIAIRDHGRSVSGMQGILVSGALGLGAHF
jgi:hypothetical protein